MANIGIFDSGVGGLTITRVIRRTLPTQSIVYVADQAHIPYAEKSVNYLRDRAHRITQFLIDSNCSTIVIACNTATVATIDFLRQTYPELSIVGTEPAIKPACTLAGNRPVLVLATKHTLQSQRLKQLVELHCLEGQVIKQDMPEWVTLAESGLISGADVSSKIHQSLKPFIVQVPASIVLACTHYPFFTPFIHQLFPKTTIFDPAGPVARQVAKLHTISDKTTPTIQFFTTDPHPASTITNLLPLNTPIQSIQL